MLAPVPDEDAQRRTLYRVLLLLLSFCTVPIGISWLPGISIPTVVAPFAVLFALILVTAIARFRGALSGPPAFAIASWGAAAVLAAAGVAALEFSAAIPEPPTALWLNKKVCRNDRSIWLLLCPFALTFDRRCR
jgi:hypothetical protein